MNLRSLAFAAPLVALVVYGCVVGKVGGDAVRETPASADASGGQPCGDDPFRCGAGTTCWPEADGGASCVPSKEYKTKGTECELLFGRSSCADGLVCISVERPLDAGPDTGNKDAAPKPLSEPYSLCAPWCDDKHPCPTGEACRALSFDGYSGRACVPTTFTVPDTGVPDTSPPDTFKPDTAKPDTGNPDDGLETPVTEAAIDEGVDDVTDGGVPETSIDTKPPPDTKPPADTATPDTSTIDSSELDTATAD